MLKKKLVYPTKTTLNLNKKDIPEGYYRKLLIATLVGIILISAFAKFAVSDRFAAATRAENEVLSEQARYQDLAKSNDAYAEVRAEYEKYFTSVNSEIPYADIMDVLQLVELNLISAAGMQSLALTDNVISVILTNITLEQASIIVSVLSNNDMVASVNVSSADTTAQNTVSSVAMTITLNAEGGDSQ